MSNPYGFGGTPASIAATGGSGTTGSPLSLAAATAGVYYFAAPQTKVIVFNHPSSGSTLLYGQWNDVASNPVVTTGDLATTSTTEWDFVLEPGGFATNPDGLAIKSVGLYSTLAATYLTAFQVRGF